MSLAQQIVSTTYDVLNENGLYDWQVKLGTALSTAGSCHYRTKTIRISLKVAEIVDWSETFDTILHEVAHAIAGHAAGHGPEWRRVAREIGLKNPQRVISGLDTSEIDPWKGVCPNGHEVTRPGAPRRVRSCSRCVRGFSAEHIFTWTKHGEEVPMPKSYMRDLMFLETRNAMA